MICCFLSVFPLLRMILSTAYAIWTLVMDLVKLKPWSRSLERICSGTGPYLESTALSAEPFAGGSTTLIPYNEITRTIILTFTVGMPTMT